jgi:cysteine synthase A
MSKLRFQNISDSILEAIGDTPLVRLNKIAEGYPGDVLVKCEYLNPSGSIKDRMAYRMITGDMQTGKIKPGVTTITESSSGNTAQALAMVSAVVGCHLKVYFPGETGMPEKMRPLTRYGAEHEVIDLEDKESDRMAKEAGLHGATIEIPGRVKAYMDEQNLENHYWIRQYANPGNALGQSQVGVEILEQTKDKVDVFIASIGTGGSFLGIARVLKQKNPATKCIAVQPLGWEGWEDPLSPEKKYIPNISGGIVEEIRESKIADEVMFVTNSDAHETAYRLSKEEGIDCGMSSGANVFVALAEAKKPEMQGKNIVTLIVDRGERYLNSEAYTT